MIKNTLITLIMAGVLVFGSGHAMAWDDGADGYIDPATGTYYPSVGNGMAVDVRTGECFHAGGLVPLEPEKYERKGGKYKEDRYKIESLGRGRGSTDRYKIDSLGHSRSKSRYKIR